MEPYIIAFLNLLLRLILVQINNKFTINTVVAMQYFNVPPDNNYNTNV